MLDLLSIIAKHLRMTNS